MTRRRSAGAAIGLVTFGFINLILFFALASPFGQIMDVIEEQAGPSHLNVTSGDVPSFLSNFTIIFGLMFLFSMIGLIVWFFLGSHELEGEEY